jgi:hypothetical protein
MKASAFLGCISILICIAVLGTAFLIYSSNESYVFYIGSVVFYRLIYASLGGICLGLIGIYLAVKRKESKILPIIGSVCNGAVVLAPVISNALLASHS